jgi:hypothetical protein
MEVAIPSLLMPGGIHDDADFLARFCGSRIIGSNRRGCVTGLLRIPPSAALVAATASAEASELFPPTAQWPCHRVPLSLCSLAWRNSCVGPRMMSNRSATPLVIAVIVGALLWVLAAVLDGRREAWDSSLYWSVAYPLALVATGCIAFVFPDRPWRWAVALFGAQFVAMCVRNGELGNLWPLGLAMFAILATPAAVVATVASRLRSRSGGDGAS